MILISIVGIVLFLSSLLCADEYTVPKIAYDITCNDINSDENIDIIIGSTAANTWNSDSISVLINDGYGNFNVSYIERENYHFLKCVNINNDNFPDILTRNEGQYVYWPNDGSGNFGESIIIDPTIGNNLKISDIDNDGDNDIIFWRSGFGSYWGILHNNGYGVFTEDIYFTTDANTMSLNIGKINNDDLDDILIATTDGPFIFYNNYPEFNQVSADSFLCSHIYSFDMDNDGNNDVGLFSHVYTGGLSCKLKILYNLGNGTFTNKDTLSFPSGTLIKDINDFNNDNYPDIVYKLSPYGSPGESIYVCLNNQNGSFSESSDYYIGSPLIFRICSSDFDDNGYFDIAITGYGINENRHGLRVLFNDGTGNFVENPQTAIEPQQPIHEITLYQNNPNPFNNYTTISYSFGNNHEYFIGKNTSIEIYNIKGQLIKTFLAFPNRGLGTSTVVWDGKDDRGNVVGAGIYFYKLTADKNEIVKKMIIMK